MAVYCTEHLILGVCKPKLYATICVSSNSDHIAVSVTSKDPCSFQYRAYLEVWDIKYKEWLTIATRNGLCNGETQTFSPKYGVTRTYRVRMYVLANGFDYYSDSFTHYG